MGIAPVPLRWVEHAAMFSVITPFALGWIAGTALQLQQAQLWTRDVYWGLGAAALMSAYVVTHIDVWRSVFTRLETLPIVRHVFVGPTRVSVEAWLQAAVWFALAGVLAFAQTGARASHYAQIALNPALEGRTLQVVGVVANLPQRMEDSARFRFEVESARDSDGALVQLPPQLLLGWYGNRLNGSDDKVQPPPADLRPGAGPSFLP